jgi:hypothetical protein
MPSLPPAIVRPLLAAAVVLASLATATQWTAALLAYDPALGAPWLDLLGLKVYAPWKVFSWWLSHGAQAPGVFARTGTLAALGGAMAGLVAIGAAARRAGHGTPSTTYGSARWARPADVHDAGLFTGKGIVLGVRDGRYLRHDGPEHVLAVAPTRSGKGVGLVVPTLMTWPGSAVIHDIKGENWQLTAGWRSRFSHCLLLDPTSPVSARFNPLLEVRKGFHEVRDVHNIADILIDPEGARAWRDHWERSAHSLLTGAILHVLYAEGEKTLACVAAFLAEAPGPLLRASAGHSHGPGVARAGIRQGSGGGESESSRESVYRMRRQVAERGLALRADEPREGSSLQHEAEAKRGLVGLGRVVAVFGRPQGDDEAGEALQAEGGAHVEDAEGGVGAARHLLGEVLRQRGEAEHGGGARGADHGEQDIGRHREAEQQRELSGHGQSERAAEEQLGRDAGAAQALGGGSQQQGARGERHRHDGEMRDDGRPVEPLNVDEPGRRPQALQREGRADAKCRQPAAKGSRTRRTARAGEVVPLAASRSIADLPGGSGGEQRHGGRDHARALVVGLVEELTGRGGHGGVGPGIALRAQVVGGEHHPHGAADGARGIAAFASFAVLALLVSSLGSTILGTSVAAHVIEGAQLTEIREFAGPERSLLDRPAELVPASLALSRSHLMQEGEPW